jgi:GAF domain-containing protein
MQADTTLERINLTVRGVIAESARRPIDEVQLDALLDDSGLALDSLFADHTQRRTRRALRHHAPGFRIGRSEDRAFGSRCRRADREKHRRARAPRRAGINAPQTRAEREALSRTALEQIEHERVQVAAHYEHAVRSGAGSWLDRYQDAVVFQNHGRQFVGRWTRSKPDN